MRRTTSKSIVNRVITKRDLENIWTVLYRHSAADTFAFEQAGADSNPYRKRPNPPTLVVESSDSTRTEADTDEIFDNDVIDLQKTSSLNFDYTNYETGKSIRVALREGDNRWHGSSFSVSGMNVAWVDSTFVEFERLFSAMRPQSNLIHKYRWIAPIPLAFALGLAWLDLMNYLVPSSTAGSVPAWAIYVREHSLLRHVVWALLCIATGYAPAFWLTDWLSKLWPTIEFDFGPEHLKRKKQIRTRVTVVGSLLVLPLVLDALERFAFGWN